MACVKMCLATEINRSRESADFSNLIPVVAVGDMVSVSVVNHSLALLRLYAIPHGLAVATFCRQNDAHASWRIVINISG